MANSPDRNLTDNPDCYSHWYSMWNFICPCHILCWKKPHQLTHKAALKYVSQFKSILISQSTMSSKIQVFHVEVTYHMSICAVSTLNIGRDLCNFGIPPKIVLVWLQHEKSKGHTDTSSRQDQMFIPSAKIKCNKVTKTAYRIT